MENLKLSEEGLFKCYGCIQGEHQLFAPRESKLPEKLVEETYIQTIHGGVTLTMAKVRSKCWVPTIRQKSVESVVTSRPYKLRFTIENHGYILCRAFLVRVKTE